MEINLADSYVVLYMTVRVHSLYLLVRIEQGANVANFNIGVTLHNRGERVTTPAKQSQPQPSNCNKVTVDHEQNKPMNSWIS